MKRTYSLLFALPLLAFAQNLRGQHLHFVSGALSTGQNAPLVAVNSNQFLSTFGYVRTLTLATNGLTAGYHQVSHPFIVAAATEAHAGPEPGAPALGSFIELQLLSVNGPSGGIFSFWETGATNPTISLLSGGAGTNSWALTESDGSPGSDPYGHVHGRSFTATKPGLYTIGFRFVDTSTNGAGGGPIHSPSDIFYVLMQADITIASVTKDSNGTTVTFGAPAGKNLLLEHSPTPAVTNSWSEVAGPVAGDDHLQSLTHSASGGAAGFYRIKVGP